MNKRLLSIDALRGVAALAVVFFHAREMNWIGISALWSANKLAPNLNAFLGYLTFPVIFGWAAVPLFFVLSGYCIHRPHVAKLARDADYRIDLKTYFVRRFVAHLSGSAGRHYFYRRCRCLYARSLPS